jgi:hypothetical protein
MDKKNKPLLISLTATEHTALMKKARELKMSASQLIRQTSLNLISDENNYHHGTKKG